MTTRSEPPQNRTRQVVLVALLISILLHQVILTTIGILFDFFEEETPEKIQEVMLLEEPVPKEEEEPQKPELTPPPRTPKTKPRRAMRRPRPAKQQPSPAPAIEEAEPALAGPPRLDPQPRPEAPRIPPKLDLDWRGFESIFGAQAQAERETYAMASLERRRTQGALGKYSAKVRRALRTNQSWVKPGNQEPLGHRQKLFHNYIRHIHEMSIHPLFADSFLESLPGLSPSDPLNNWSLHMVAEFEIFASGHISEIRVIRTSGVSVFDAGAIDSIYRSSPFPPPPKSVLSWNNRVYLRWGFYRNHRKCGVFNVEPYILRSPGADKETLPIEKFTIDDG